jgi:cell division protein FtsL
MFISVGWFLFVGGFLSAIGVATAKKFLKSDFANSDGVISEEDYKTEVTLTPQRRSLIVAICIVIAVTGVFWIQHDNNWNPFQPVVGTQSFAH